jgi:WD40 repeat protein
LEFESGISEIAVLNRSKLLVGEMLGRVTRLDLNHLSEETVVRIKGVDHRAPIKCIKWQPGQEEVFATASQDGSIQFSDLRCPVVSIGSLLNPHQLVKPSAKSRSTMTGLVFHPLRPEYFYTTGTPDTCVRLWDMRQLSGANTLRNSRSSKKSQLAPNPVEEFNSANGLNYTARKHRSSVALTTDSTGSRLFVAASNDK